MISNSCKLVVHGPGRDGREANLWSGDVATVKIGELESAGMQLKGFSVLLVLDIVVVAVLRAASL